MADNNFKRIYESYYSKYDNGLSDSRWAESEEIKNALTKIDFNRARLKKGGIPCMSDGRSVWIDTGDSHSADTAEACYRICISG